jgi:hypothetical protein
MNGYKESDSPIISEKPSNKTGDNKPVAENHYLPGTFRVIDVWEASEPFRASSQSLPNSITRAAIELFAIIESSPLFILVVKLPFF